MFNEFMIFFFFLQITNTCPYDKHIRWLLNAQNHLPINSILKFHQSLALVS